MIRVEEQHICGIRFKVRCTKLEIFVKLPNKSIRVGDVVQWKCMYTWPSSVLSRTHTHTHNAKRQGGICNSGMKMDFKDMGMGELV